MLPEIDQPVRADQGRRRRGHQHLAAVRRRSNPRRPMHLQPHIARLVHRHLTRVHTHPHTQPQLPERQLRLPRGRQRTRRRRKRDKKRIPRRIHLNPAVRHPRHPTHTVMLRQKLPVPLATQLLQQHGRPLDIREQERHRPRRKRRSRHEATLRRGSSPHQRHAERRAGPNPVTLARIASRRQVSRRRHSQRHRCDRHGRRLSLPSDSLPSTSPKESEMRQIVAAVVIARTVVPHQQAEASRTDAPPEITPTGPTPPRRPRRARTARSEAWQPAHARG